MLSKFKRLSVQKQLPTNFTHEIHVVGFNLWSFTWDQPKKTGRSLFHENLFFERVPEIGISGRLTIPHF